MPDTIESPVLEVFSKWGAAVSKITGADNYSMDGSETNASGKKAYLEAEKIRQKRKDAELWQAGIYETSATFTAVANALMGKKSKAEYLKKPLLESAEEEKRKQEGILSEEEKKKQRNALLASLQLMQANFELNHEKGRQDE